MNQRIAYLSADCMQKGSPNQREDYWEHDLMFGAMQSACAALGLDLQTVVWDAKNWQPKEYDAIVLGTPWDYMEQPEAFFEALQAFSKAAPLFNPVETVRWNLDKHYLYDLQQWGAPSVPTCWLETASPEGIERAFTELDCEEMVIKPRIGASAWRQARLRRGATLPPASELPPGACLAQPFLPSVATEGELSFVFFNGHFSHALRKVPQAGDYRVQSMYGANEHVHEPSREELTVVRSLLDGLRVEWLYARVDMVVGLEGQLVVMELEMIEALPLPRAGPPAGRGLRPGAAGETSRTALGHPKTSRGRQALGVGLRCSLVQGALEAQTL